MFPDLLKVAKVIPIPKVNNANTLDKFRPISILPILSKPLERYIHFQLSTYLTNNNLLYSLQSGFRPEHSCHTSLIHLCDTWLKAINNRNMVGVVFLDLRKAFDLVDHEILIQKLELYLNNKNVTSLFTSYLSNRIQRVYLNCSYSDAGCVSSGVPQGSILGPILFCLYINDLPLCLSNPSASLELFADDSTLHTQEEKLSEIESVLQQSIQEIADWCDNNKMVLHPDKTKSMILASRQKHQIDPLEVKLKLGTQDIKQVHVHKVLGVIIDDELTFKHHLNALSKKLSRNIFLMKKLRSIISPEYLLPFFHAHIMSHINYSSTIWSETKTEYIKQINSLHRRAVKTLSNTQFNLSTDEKFTHLNILTLQQQFTFNKAVMMYKIFYESAPQYLNEFFRKQKRDLRNKNYILPNVRIELYKTSLAYAGASTWNILPSICRNATSISLFKKRLKLHFFQLN